MNYKLSLNNLSKKVKLIGVCDANIIEITDT